MAQPQNQRLWTMLVTQAKTKFNEWPSLPASKWVHSEYVKKGGQFVEGKHDTDSGKKKEQQRRHNEASERHKERSKKRGR